MNINLNNYTTYFLLYIDNELSIQDKQAVENFVKENNWLQAEFDEYTSLVLPTNEESISIQKEKLYKKENSVDIYNYTTYACDYVDNELSQIEKQDFEQFITEYPAAASLVNQLQQSKLLATSIEHPNKKALYKKQKTPIIWFKALPYAAAAALIMILGMQWYKQYNSQTVINNEPMAIVNHPKNQDTTNNTIVSNPKGIKEQLTTVAKSMVSKPIINKNNYHQQTEKTNSLVTELSTTQKSSGQNITVEQPIIIASVTPPVANPTATAEKAATIDIKKLEKEEAQLKALTKETYTYLNVDDVPDNEKEVYVGSIKLNKNKVKNTFGSISKLFSK